MKYKTRCQGKLIAEVRSLYAMVDVKPQQGLFNQRCFHNAVEFAKADPLKRTEVVECIYVTNEGEPILHYLNKQNGVYLETTLGHQAAVNEYYVIKVIHPADYTSIANEFDRSLRYWTERHTTLWGKYVMRIERLV